MLEKLKIYENKYYNKFIWYAIVFYDKNNKNTIIKDIKSLKNIDNVHPNDILNSPYVKQFSQTLDHIISELNKSGNNPVFVFPPTKPHKNNQVIELIKKLGYNLPKIDYIELTSPFDFELKNIKTMEERSCFLKDEYRKFKVKASNEYIKNKDKNFYIFIDDVITNGIFMCYCMKRLSEEFDNKIFPSEKYNVRGLFLAKAEEINKEYYKKYKTIMKEKWIE